MYTCSECGSPITVTTEGDIIRPYCEHNNAAVLANMVATVYGEGAMQKMLVRNVDPDAD